jgi:hypothetical protein
MSWANVISLEANQTRQFYVIERLTAFGKEIMKILMQV